MLAYRVKMPSGEHRLLTPSAFEAYRSMYLLEKGCQPDHETVYTTPKDRVLTLLDLYTPPPI